MSFGLLLPLGLLALAAWALPLLLHLARREQQQPTDFAALRWLAAKLRPRQRLRFEELPLLALRLLLLAALALLLARPVSTGSAADGWLVVHPALDAPPADADDRRQRRWLAPGFPALDTPRPALPVATTSLVRQLDAELPAASTLTVQVPDWFDGADGERLRLSRTIEWQVTAIAAPAEFVATPRARPPLAIRHDDAHAGDVRWLRATALAWSAAAATEPAAIDVTDTTSPLPAPTTVVAWLAAGDIPEALRTWIAAGGTALLSHETTWPLGRDGEALWRDHDGTIIASAAALGRGRIVRLQRPLQPAALPALLEADFPARLRALLTAPPPAPGRSAAAAMAPRPGAAGFPPLPQSADSLLIALVLSLFALERWLASGRRGKAGA